MNGGDIYILFDFCYCEIVIINFFFNLFFKIYLGNKLCYIVKLFFRLDNMFSI